MNYFWQLYIGLIVKSKKHMNKIYYFFIFVIGFSFSMTAQSNLQNDRKDIRKQTVIIGTPTAINTNESTPYVHFWKYLFDDKKMKSFFIDEKIPSNFPLYDQLKTFEENKAIAKKWGSRNKNLIKKDARQKLNH